MDFRSFYQRQKRRVLTEWLDKLPSRYHEAEFGPLRRANQDRWVANALKIRDEAPRETAIYWSEILRSNFTIRYLHLTQERNGKRADAWTAKEQVEFLHHIFEHGYLYFGFMNMGDQYRPGYLSTVHPKWYEPEKAKKPHAAWGLTEDGHKLTGKRWVLENLPYCKTVDLDFGILRSLRNANSHESLVAKDERIFLLDEFSGSEDVTEDAKKLCQFFYDAQGEVAAFMAKLFLREDFWVFPVLTLLAPDAFNYRRKEPDWTLVKQEDEPNQNGKKKIDPNRIADKLASLKELTKDAFHALENEPPERWEAILEQVPYEKLGLLVVPGMMIEFLYSGLADTIRRLEDQINAATVPHGYEIDLACIDSYEQKAPQIVTSMLEASCTNLDRIVFKPATIPAYKFLTVGEGVRVFMEKAKTIAEHKERGKNDLFLVMFDMALVISAALLGPLTTLQEHADQLFVQGVDEA